MTEGDKAGLWVVVYLSITLFATWFTIICLFVSFVKELL
jgi:hypothetical protein